MVPRDGSGAVSPVVGVQRVEAERTATVRFEGIGGGLKWGGGAAETEKIGLGIPTAPGVNAKPGGRDGNGVGMAVDDFGGLEAAESSASRSYRRSEWQSAFWRTARSVVPQKAAPISCCLRLRLSYLFCHTLRCTIILLRATKPGRSSRPSAYSFKTAAFKLTTLPRLRLPLLKRARIE